MCIQPTMSDEKNHSVEQPDRKGEVYERRSDEPGSVPADKEGSEGGYGGQA